MVDPVDETIEVPLGPADRMPRNKPTFREVLGWHLESFFGSATARVGAAPRRFQLIESLGDVADAISSGGSTTEVLTTVVDEAKHLMGTDKAVLCLLATGIDGPEIDESAVFVRGRRDQYPETWWRAKIAEAGRSAIEQRMPVVEMVDRTWLMTVPVKTKGRLVGVLAVMNPMSRRFTDDQVALIAVLGAFAGTAIENARLQSQSQYALLADERSRIAKEMHDGLSQSLFSSSLELDICRKKVLEDPEGVAKRLDKVQTILVRSLSELRRYIHDLRPLSLNALGLIGALHQRLNEIGDARGVSVRVYTEGDERALPPGVEAALYRVAQEGVTNIAKHADAKHAIVILRFEATKVLLTIEDDGRGFDLEEAYDKVEREESLGLKSMRERVQNEGGQFTITSGKRGTTVKVDIPC